MLVENYNRKIQGEYELDSQLFLPDGNQQYPAVLLTHGLLSAKEEFGDLPQTIASKGYVVLTFDFRGHGKSQGDRGYYTSTSHLDDAERALKYLLSQVRALPNNFAIIGHSLGSIAATRLVTESSLGKKAKTCILLAPPRKFSDSVSKIELNAYSALHKLTWPLLLLTGKHIYVPYQYSEKDIFLSDSAIKRAQELGFLQNKLSLNNYYYMIKQIDHEKYASNISMPSLVAVAKDDKLVPNYGSKAVFNAIKSTDKKYVEIENSGHSMMDDLNKDSLETEIISWLENHLS